MRPQHALDARGMYHNCGIFGIFAPSRKDIARTTMYGIHAMQHRGQESAGICVTDGKTLTFKKGMGFVSQVFDNDTVKSLNNGIAAIGHTRYSTEGLSVLQNAHPVEMHDSYSGETIALAHNGTIVGAQRLRSELEAQGCVFNTQTDTEAFGHLLLSYNGSWEERLSQAMAEVQAAYSMVLLTRDSVIAFRDPYGIRPLCVGVLQQGERKKTKRTKAKKSANKDTSQHYIIASESHAIQSVNATFIREVTPGEMVVIDKNGLHAAQLTIPKPASCVFEQIYLAYDNSLIEGELVRRFRTRTGDHLARIDKAHNSSPDADIVTDVPDSAYHHARGYARASGIPYGAVFMKNQDVARTFISPTQRLRDLDVQHKYTVNKELVQGQRVVVVDDSIVRGTTMPKIVDLLKEAGATEVHIRVASPPIKYPCHLGVDIATQDELIANKYELEDMRVKMGADSLEYLSVEALESCVGEGKNRCTGCFTGVYPIDNK